MSGRNWQGIPDWLVYAVRWHHAKAMTEGRRRLAARLTVTGLAAKARCNAGYLSQLEHGKYSASVRILGQLADALGCDITDLMPPEPLAEAS